MLPPLEVLGRPLCRLNDVSVVCPPPAYSLGTSNPLLVTQTSRHKTLAHSCAYMYPVVGLCLEIALPCCACQAAHADTCQSFSAFYCYSIHVQHEKMGSTPNQPEKVDSHVYRAVRAISPRRPLVLIRRAAVHLLLLLILLLTLVWMPVMLKMLLVLLYRLMRNVHTVHRRSIVEPWRLH